MTKVLPALALIPITCPAASLYDNSDPGADQGFSVFYPALGFTEIGDQLQLTSAGSPTSLTTQFYNAGGVTATFDAVLRFNLTGSPAGTPTGNSFSVTGISIGSNASQNVTFSTLGSISVPQNAIVTMAVENVATGGDIGVNLFDPPLLGDSSNSIFIAYDGTTFSSPFSGLDIDSSYLTIEGDRSVPEPATAGAAAAAPMLLGCCKRRRKRKS